jgi:uncharacterized membrane protein
MGSILKKYLWHPFHVWFFAMTAYGVLNLVVNLVETPHFDFAFLSLFPLFWVVLSITKRLEGNRVQGFAPFFLPVCLYVPIHLIFYQLGGLPSIALKTNFAMFEASSYVWFAIFLAHSFTVLGLQPTVRLFGIGLIYGAFLENIGIVMGFFSEPSYSVYVPPLPAPVFTMIGWCTVFYAAARFTDDLTEKKSPPLLKAFVCTAAAVSLDVLVDSAASLFQWWVWDPKLKPFFFGVPLVNYSAWASAIFPYAYFFFRTESVHTGETRKTRAFLKGLPFVPIAALALVLGLTFTLEPGARAGGLFIENGKAVLARLFRLDIASF